MRIIFLLWIMGILLLNKPRSPKLYVIIPSCLRFGKYLKQQQKSCYLTDRF